MRFRGKSIRRKIVALLLVPLMSLTALWGFATVLTGREAGQLLDATAVAENVGTPVEDMAVLLQEERRQTLVYLADRRASDALPALRTRRDATDGAVAAIRDAAARQSVRDDMTGETSRQLTALLDALDGMTALRRSVDGNTVSRAEALTFYNGLVDPSYTFLATVRALNDSAMERQGRALLGLLRAREMLSREDALVASTLTTRKVTAPEIRALSDLVAQRKLHYEVNLAGLPGREREIVKTYWRSPETAPLRDAEERLIAAGPDNRLPSADLERWEEAATPVLDDLAREAVEAGDRYHDRIEPAAYGVFVRAGVAGVLGFLALLVSVIVSVRIGRDLVRDLSRLRKEAHEVSGVRLPSVMRRLAAGEHVDVETEAPRLEYDKDEIGQAGQALNTLQRAAVEAAVRQADMRRGVSEVFVNLARRNQVLLHRQLTLLDAMERRTEDTEELADLFRLDHLTTRMRRHAEGLVILSGAAPSRQWRKPIQLMDVVRAAVAEVEDYERIEVRRLPRIGVGGPAVADLTHLIAELLENATVFSPPHTGVQVHGERVANGFTLEIHDRGLGMTPDALLDANLRLAETPEFELSDTDRLGLFVVSRLAQRQNVRVSLQQSPYGGTTAVVFIPAALLTEAPETQGTGFRLDRKSDSAAGRREQSRLALSQIPPGPAAAALLDGPVELEAPLGPEDRDRDAARARERGTAATSAPAVADPAGLGDIEDTESARGGIFRARSLQRDGDQGAQRGARPAAAPPLGPVPLPRRRPPTLVADHGRRVDDRGAEGRHHPHSDQDDAAPEPTRGGRGAGNGPVPLPRPLDGRERVRPFAMPPADARPGPADGPAPAGPFAPARGTASSADTGPASGARHLPAPGTDGPASDAAGARGSAAPGTDGATVGGLPRRVRQASLVPQLRDTGDAERPPAPAAPRDDERDAEQVRARMASMQRGWQRGRRQNADESGAAPGTDRTSGSGRTAPGTTSEGDGP
ncbi:nitrate- and nitrite sensing domain-containing protein [Streptomyces zhihengii]|uniref:histidine kinase n=1 Tax=Streptomyces zhihengii TaxID=1818004 RepID=A0ABS2UZ60_9ACTN|nr:nitrate- and nitrite sensing domain-containing protein [Streptomyces zhihengii]MBM9622804.1 nitrate- and nitrite sensing domain-containing protein [Streptomyces zhihengii]